MLKLQFKILFWCLISGLVFIPFTAQAQDRDRVEKFLEDLLGSENTKNNSHSNGFLKRFQKRDDVTGRQVPQSRQQIQLSFAPLVQQTENAVVNIFANRMAREQSPFANDPFFEQFFGRRFEGRRQMQNSLGSGVIVNENGTIITNNHVVANADEIRVVLGDGREFNARLLVKDEGTDLAVLRIDAGEKLPALPLADSDELEVGDLVLAIGNPFGVGKTVTSGIVSALARARVSLSDFGFFIQTDAAINPGNSGGALIDMQGKLVGINTAIYSRSGGSNGIGFAIPSNMVNVILRSAEEKNNFSNGLAVAKPYIGVQFRPVTNEIARQRGMRNPRGALVVDLDPNGPGRKAGLKIGDIVLVVDAEPISNPDEMGYRLYTAPIGSILRAKILRDKRIIDLDIKIISETDADNFDEISIRGRNPFDGAKVADINYGVLRKLRIQLRDPSGVIVTDVERRSTAARFVKPGDVIRSINGIKIRSIEDLRDVITRGGRSWRYVLERDGGIVRQFVRS